MEAQLLAASAVRAASRRRRAVGTSLPPCSRSSSPARTHTYLPTADSGTATPSAGSDGGKNAEGEGLRLDPAACRSRRWSRSLPPIGPSVPTGRLGIGRSPSADPRPRISGWARSVRFLSVRACGRSLAVGSWLAPGWPRSCAWSPSVRAPERHSVMEAIVGTAAARRSRLGESARAVCGRSSQPARCAWSPKRKRRHEHR